jgi:hypothetical protein
MYRHDADGPNYRVSRTNRGKEVLVKATPEGGHTLVVETR